MKANYEPLGISLDKRLNKKSKKIKSSSKSKAINKSQSFEISTQPPITKKEKVIVSDD